MNDYPKGFFTAKSEEDCVYDLHRHYSVPMDEESAESVAIKKAQAIPRLTQAEAIMAYLDARCAMLKELRLFNDAAHLQVEVKFLRESLPTILQNTK